MPSRRPTLRLTRRLLEGEALRALQSLPPTLASRLENVAILVEEEPPSGVAPDTLGLYEGVPLTERSSGDLLLPDRITLFRGPLARACRSLAEMRREVRLTVLHEVGHFFGLDEAALEKL